MKKLLLLLILSAIAFPFYSAQVSIPEPQGNIYMDGILNFKDAGGKTFRYKKHQATFLNLFTRTPENTVLFADYMKTTRKFRSALSLGIVSSPLFGVFAINGVVGLVCSYFYIFLGTLFLAAGAAFLTTMIIGYARAAFFKKKGKKMLTQLCENYNEYKSSNAAFNEPAAQFNVPIAGFKL